MASSKPPSRRPYEFAGETIRSKVTEGSRRFRRELIVVSVSLDGKSGQCSCCAVFRAVMNSASWQSRMISGILAVIVVFCSTGKSRRGLRENLVKGDLDGRKVWMEEVD